MNHIRDWRFWLCIALHAFVLWNVWHAYELTPRIIEMCPR